MSEQSPLRAVKRMVRQARPYLRALTARSYSQYCEDALIFNAMSPERRGFYVDVGAYDPVDGSNTYKFYRRGWRGITIEPNPGVAWRFRALRGRDTHLTMGVSAEESTLRYFAFDIGMLNTTDAARAESLKQSGYALLGERDVRCAPLSAIMAEHAPGRHIDVLNIDCEGLDLAVLQSLDFSAHRPTVVIVEDLERYYGLGADAAAGSAIAQFMLGQGYAPIAQLIFTTVFVALDWRALNRRTGAFREAAIHPGLLPEAPAPGAA